MKAMRFIAGATGLALICSTLAGADTIYFTNQSAANLTDAWASGDGGGEEGDLTGVLIDNGGEYRFSGTGNSYTGDTQAGSTGRLGWPPHPMP